MTYLPIIAEIKYIELIDRAEQENRKKGDGNYYEKHHITPKCFGGSNDASNLVLLTGREHFEAHKLLCDMYQDDKKKYYQMLCAMHKMIYGVNKDKYNITVDEYENVRKVSSLIGHSNKGRIHSIESRKNMSISRKGRTVWNKGIPHTEATKEKQRQKMTGRKQSEETKQKRSKSLKGKCTGQKKKKHSIEANKAKSEREKGKNKGRIHSDTTKLKRRITWAKKRLIKNNYPLIPTKYWPFTRESDIELIRNYEQTLET